MKNKIIILIVSIIVIIVFLLGSIIYIRTNDNKDVITEDKKDDNLIETSNQDTVESIDNNSQLLIVKNYIQSFIEQINLNNVIYYTGGNKIDQSIIARHTYNLLSKEYIGKNSISFTLLTLKIGSIEYVEFELSIFNIKYISPLFSFF